ncbi:MAG: hypothetical protein AAF357_15765, partial [Verrucomicrobiota bacterium]
LETDRENIDASIAAMLDNISTDTRDLIEQRIAVLRKQREGLRVRSAELDRLSLREAEVQDTVQELGGFIAGLDVMLAGSINDLRVAAIRRCITRIDVDRLGSVSAEVRLLPATGVQTKQIALHEVISTASARNAKSFQVFEK